MKFTFREKTFGSGYSSQYGLDLLAAQGQSVNDAAWERGWRFSPTDSMRRMNEIQRARDLSSMTEDQLREKYNPFGNLQSTDGFLDPDTDFLNTPENIPTLREFREKGFQGDATEILSAKEANSRYGIMGRLQFEENTSNLEAFLLQQRKLEEIKFNYVLNRAEGSDWWRGMGIEMSAALLDPINAAAMVIIPPVGAEVLAARMGLAASRTGQRAVSGALAGFYGTAAVEPLIYSAAQQEQADYDMTHSLMNVTFGAVAGAGLSTVGGKLVDGVRYLRRRRHEQSIRTAINQMANGETPEVQPIAYGADEVAAQGPVKAGDLDGPLSAEDVAADPILSEQAATKAEVGAERPVVRQPSPEEAPNSPVTEYAPHREADVSLSLLEKVNKAASLTAAKVKDLLIKSTELREAFEAAKNYKTPIKNKFAFRIFTPDGKAVLIRPQPGQPLSLITSDQLTTLASDFSNLGEALHQAAAIHGVDLTATQVNYSGSYKFNDGSIHHVIDATGTFEPKMNQNEVVVAKTNEVPALIADSPYVQAFSGYAPKGSSAVKSQYDTEGPMLSSGFEDVDISKIDGIDEALNVENLKQTGQQAGTQKGGFFEDMATGQQYYVKFPDNPDAAINEFVAANLYRLFGVEMPATRLVMKDGQVAGVASEIMPGAKTISPDDFLKLDAKQKQAFISNAIVDMYLGNWDVVGNAPNWNIVLLPDGRVVRLDPGGALVYRAQGGKKELSDALDELQTMVDEAKAPTAAKVFKSEDWEMLSQDAVQRILETPEQAINDLIDLAGLSDAAKLKQALDNRRVALQSKYPQIAQKAVLNQDKTVLTFSKSKALEYLTTQAKRFFAQFTNEESSAIQKYAGSYYNAINKFMRMTADEKAAYLKKAADKYSSAYVVVKTVNALKSAMEKSSIQKMTRVFRGNTPHQVFDGVNGLKLADHQDIKTAKAMIGGIIEIDQFNSTSMDKSFATHWGSSQTPLLTIDLPPGTRAIYGDKKIFPHFSGEAEIILDAGLKYMIKNARQLPNGRLEIRLEVLPDNWKPQPKVNKKMAIKMAQAHKEEAPNATSDSQEMLPNESDNLVQETLRLDDGSKQLKDVSMDIDQVKADIEAELANMDDSLVAAFAKELENIEAEGAATQSYVQDLYKAAQAAAVCIRR